MNGKQYREAQPYPRLPYDPLRRWSLAVLTDRLQVSKEVLYDWMTNGLSFMKADQVAIRMGYHPVSLWPDWYELQTVAPMKSHQHKSKA